MQLSNPKFKKLGRAAQKRVSQKIRKLVHEDYDQDQAAAIAYKYERAHKLGPRGGRKRNPSYANIPDEVMELMVSVGKPDKVLKDMYAWPESTIMIFVEPRNEVEVTRLLNKHGFVVFDKLKSKGRPAILVVSKSRFGKNPIKDNEIAKCLAALAGMINHPDRCEDVDEEILNALESEGLWNIDEGVTEKGKKFLYDAGWEESDEFYD